MRPICSCNTTIGGSAEAGYTKEDSDDPMRRWHYAIFKCPECLSPVIVEETFDPNAFKYYMTRQLYPVPEYIISNDIPAQLVQAVNEATDCYKAGAYTSTAIMCGRILEGFCELNGLKTGQLYKSLNQLKENGVINDDLLQWAHMLRVNRNDAAHNIKVMFDKQEARDLLDFTIQILEFTYSFKQKFETYKARVQLDMES